MTGLVIYHLNIQSIMKGQNQINQIMKAFYKQTNSTYNLTKRKQGTYRQMQNFTKICYLWLQ